MNDTKFTTDELVTEFPDSSPKQIRSAIKYQEKFSLTLENLKCLNPDCNKMRKWGTDSTSFRYCCASPCTKIMQSVIKHNAGKRAQQTYFEKTGFKSTMHNPEAVARHKQTTLQNNGVENIFFKKEYIDQKRLEKIGYSYPIQNPEIKNKIKQTCLEKYGFENPLQNLDIKNKVKNTYLERAGFSNPAHNPVVIKKRKDTYFERTGYFHYSLNPEIKNQIVKTNLKRYGVNNSVQLHLLNYDKWMNKEFWEKTFITKTKHFDLHNCMKYFNCKQASAHKQLKLLNIDYIKLGGISLIEQDLADYIKTEFNLEIVQNVRNIISPLELDIYIPALKLAIEYNGAYWHSYHPEIGTCEKQLDFKLMRSRHQQKSLACLNKGIRLLHIYEDNVKYSKIEEFINWEYEAYEYGTEFDLDAGCYPINLKPEEFEILEPESQIVLSDRTLWNAGKIKMKGTNENQ